jgi:hypothetical protein
MRISRIMNTSATPSSKDKIMLFHFLRRQYDERLRSVPHLGENKFSKGVYCCAIVLKPWYRVSIDLCKTSARE